MATQRSSKITKKPTLAEASKPLPPSSEDVLSDANWSELIAPPKRVKKRLYFFVFFLITAFLSIGSVTVIHDDESGFLRFERMNPRLRVFSLEENVTLNDQERADLLDVSLEEYRTAENVLDSFFSNAQSRPGFFDWAMRVGVANYTVMIRYQVFLFMAIAFVIAWTLYVRARDSMASDVIDEQNKGLKKLNKELEKNVSEAKSFALELEQAQEKLVQAQKLASIGRMSATLAHEIRNPMSIMMSAAGMAADDLEEGTPPREAVDLIRQEITRLDSIITDLLNFARPKPPGLGDHDLNNMVQAWLVGVSEELQKSGTGLVDDLEEELPTVICDADQLYQVFLNIVWNARDAVSEKGGTIEIRTERSGPRSVFLVVQDNGPGMDEETINNIFEPFFTTKTHGSGLGLPVVQQLMEGMGGSVFIESTPDEGTTVYLHLSITTEFLRAEGQAAAKEAMASTT